MYTSTIERFLDKNIVPTETEIENLIGKSAVKRLQKFEAFLNSSYEIARELKFPFGNNYGWGYKFSQKSKLLCYLFFEKGYFTVTITIGKSELNRLNKQLNSLLPKTKELWDNRYPCGEGGWIHYRVESDAELSDVQKLICIKKKPNIKTPNLYL
ncbi:MAG: DUF3788 domain-containing protein [Bacillota bacterium]|nr:DUF3788 domain-containing protein [Bacillota bacterium]